MAGTNYRTRNILTHVDSKLPDSQAGAEPSRMGKSLLVRTLVCDGLAQITSQKN